MSEETGNATIRLTRLGKEDHGIPSFYLQLDMRGSSQSFGGWDLRFPGYGINLVIEILDVVGVETWESLKGAHVRYRRQNGLLCAIGHIIEDKWLAPEEWGKSRSPEVAS